MKALTLWQPWAYCIAHSDKRVENRSWPAPARQRVSIGNAVPPAAAEAIARACGTTLRAAAEGGLLLAGDPVWVAPTAGAL